MSIAPTWCRSNNGNDHPLGHVLSIPHVEQVEVIRSQASSACCTSIDDHLHLFDISRRVSGSWRRWDSLDYDEKEEFIQFELISSSWLK